MAHGPDDDLVALMIGYQAGKLEAFEGLYSIVAPELRRYFGPRAAGSAMDLVQETFLEIHRSRHTYTPPLPVRPWVYGVARNVERRYWRRHRRHEAPLVEMENLDVKPAEAPGSIDWRDVEDGVRRLPHAGREAWLLHHLQGFSFAEIGARLRIETGAARLRAHRTMTALRELLRIERKQR